MNTIQEPVHPGQELANELGELGLRASVFANLIKVPKNRITQLLSGTRSMTPDTALRLERFFGKSALYWMNLQSRYDLRMAYRASRTELMKLPSIKGIRDSLPRG